MCSSSQLSGEREATHGDLFDPPQQIFTAPIKDWSQVFMFLICLLVSWSNKTYSSPVFWLSVDHRNITNVYSLYKLSLRIEKTEEESLNNELSKMLTRTTLFPRQVSQGPTAVQSDKQSSAPLQHPTAEFCHTNDQATSLPCTIRHGRNIRH